MSADYRMGDGVVIKEEELEKAQKKKEVEKLKILGIEEVDDKTLAERELEAIAEEDELLDEVDEEDISEISLEPEVEEQDSEEETIVK